jgi:hypothetical protein
LWDQKKQTLDLDGSRPLQSWDTGLGDRGPQQRDVQALVADGAGLEVLLLGHRWLAGLSWVHSSRRPDCQQDLHDSCRGREHPVAALLGKVAPQDVVLLQVRGDAEALDSIATALPQVWRAASPSINHMPIQQRLFSDNRPVTTGCNQLATFSTQAGTRIKRSLASDS